MTHVIIDNDADTVRIVRLGEPAIAIKFDMRSMSAARQLTYELINAVVGESRSDTSDQGVTLMVQNDGVCHQLEEW